MWLSTLFNIGMGTYSAYEVSRFYTRRKLLQDRYNELVDELNNHIDNFNNYIEENELPINFKMKDENIH